MVKVFVICLSTRQQHSQCINSWYYTFKNVNIFDAVKGATIDLTDSSLVHPLVHLSINTGKQHSTYDIPSRGAIGCFLSHYELWQRCVSLNEPIIIMEEDVFINEESAQFLQTIISNIPHTADLVSLMYIFLKFPTNSYKQVFAKIEGPEFAGTQMYYITPRGARGLIKDAFPIFTQVDLFIGLQTYRKKLNTYGVRKRLYSISNIIIDNMSSSIQRFSVKKYLPCDNLFYIIILSIVTALITTIVISFQNEI